MNNMLTVSGSPHSYGGWSVKKIMYLVILAMIPAMGVSFYYFGWGAVRITLISVVTCVLIEYLFMKVFIKGPNTISDGSAIITGMLLAFNVPTNLPTWMVIVGAIVAIWVGKMSFGGLGKNPFNPALVGRVFLFISFPVEMTSWPKPFVNNSNFFFGGGIDAITGPTQLGILKSQGVDAITPDHVNYLFGQMGGSMGEISALALIIGGIILLATRVITWHIPVSFLLSAFIFAGIFWWADPTQYADPLFHMVTGGMILGVFYMATDMVTSPMSVKGQIIFVLVVEF
jgi:electron transport complex protein RnfD